VSGFFGASFGFGAFALIVVGAVRFVMVSFAGFFVMVIGVVAVLFGLVAAFLAVLVGVAGFGFLVSSGGLSLFGASKLA